MLEIDPISYQITDTERGISVRNAGGNPDGDSYHLIEGDGWSAKFSVRPFPGRYPYLRGLTILQKHGSPPPAEALRALISEVATLIEATCLKSRVDEVNATFHPESFA